MSDQVEQSNQATDQAAAPAAGNPPSDAAPAFAIPDAYKDRGWVEKVKSSDDLFKAYDNAVGLLGKRPAGIPGADAPDAEHEAFYKALRPESADKYTLSDIDGVPENMDLAPYKAQAQKMMYEAGLTPKQADAMWKQYVTTEIGAVARTQEKLDKRFDEVATKVLGDKREAASAVAQEAIKTYVSEELRTSFVNNPDGMVAMIELANGYEAKIAAVRAEYGAEGKLPGGGQQVAASDIGETVAKLAKLRLSPEAADFTKPGHAKVMDEIKSMQAVVARHYNK
jgi:hypothetical protein